MKYNPPPARGRMSGLGYSNTRDAALLAVGGRRGMRGNLKQAPTHLSPWFCPPSPHRLPDSFIFRCEGSIFRSAWRGYKLAVLHRNAEMLNSVGVHYFLRQQVRLSKEVEFLSWPYGSLFTVLQCRIIRSTCSFLVSGKARCPGSARRNLAFVMDFGEGQKK